MSKQKEGVKRGLACLVLSAVMMNCLAMSAAWAEAPALSLSVIKVKTTGRWTEVAVALENQSDKDLELQCCQMYLETEGGYALNVLTQDEVQSQIYNRAKTGASMGALAAAGLGLAGLISGKKELGYAALGVGATSGIAGVMGESSADKRRREVLIDDIMKNQTFPAGLKVAGVAYFPPKKQWYGAKHLENVYLTFKGAKSSQSYRISAPVEN